MALFRIVLAAVLLHCIDSGAASLPGQVERLEIVSRGPAFGGASFGQVGQYETIVAIAHMRIDPQHPANRIIADLDKAPREGGVVRYQSDVIITRPRDPSWSSHVLLLDIPNRGTPLGHYLLNDTRDGAGLGFTLRRGHTLLWVGWQGDIALGGDGMRIGTRLPVARDHGATITGPHTEEVVFDDLKSNAMALTYPPASDDLAAASLTVRPNAHSAPTPLPVWHYEGEHRIELVRPVGYDAGAIYTFRYLARDPIVMGLGFAALRDVTSFLKSGAPDAAGRANPLADIRTDLVAAIGISQSGRVLRDFIWHGMNADPRGGKVFDVAMPVIAGSRKSFVNARFAAPGRYSTQHLDHLTPGDQFPFSYAVTTDPVSGRTDGIFARCQKDDTCPKLAHIDSAVEFWQGRASLVVTDGAGHDIALPPNVRAYLMSSTQHVAALAPKVGTCQQLNNPAQQGPLLRAMLDNMVAWARAGKEPPASRFPRIGDAGLVRPLRDEVGFPDLRALGVGFPTVINDLTVVDDSTIPPKPDPARRYQLLVPMTDLDGNDLGGVRLPDVAVPLATYTGWNLRRAGLAQDQLCDLNGMSVPLPAGSRDGDPRLPLAQRYPNRMAYAKAVASAARALRDQGLLLDEDVARYIERARADSRIPD